MTNRLHKWTLLAVSSLAGVVTGGLVLGPTLSSATGETTDSSQQQEDANFSFRDPRPEEVVAEPPFPVNENGQTFGSGMAIDENNSGPELLAAYGTNGAFGYILATDRASRLPDRLITEIPEPKAYTIPLYASDGVTVLGEFAITPGRSTFTTMPGSQ